MIGSLIEKLFYWVVRLPTKIVPWHRLPVGFISGLAVGGIRYVLREQNLFDTEELTHADPPPNPDDHSARAADGSFNDLSYPLMGQARTRRFARNVPIQYAYPEDEPAIMQPSPRTVSLELLTRHDFIPVRSLNLLAAAWIQFQVHDWFNHTRTDDNPWELKLPDDDPWHQHPMRIERTAMDPDWSPDEGIPPAYINTSAHWWAGSQIYGSTDERLNQLRSWEDGKLIVGQDGLLPVDPETGVDITGFNENWWIGLSLLHTLFTHEHNAICDGLRSEYRDWNDERIFQHARLINAAVMAKIHTIEWTPGILAHPALQIGMSTNWWGLMGKQFRTRIGRIGNSEILSGIMGSRTDHHSGIYAMTEEFVSVYRMHQLVPDEFSFRSRANDEVVQQPTLSDVVFGNARRRLNEMFEQGTTIEDVFYSFGTSHPGAIVLHNFPKTLQEFRRQDGELIDLAAIDVMRDRERGVPRYNTFRELMHMPRVKSFEKLTNNPEWAEEIRSVYDNDIDRVDAMVGMFAEPFPKGFGFSDTAFRIFVLMASRRLKSDRFFTSGYTPEVYTPFGMKWINDNTMSDVLIRHYPSLERFVRSAKNPFAPWRKANM